MIAFQGITWTLSCPLVIVLLSVLPPQLNLSCFFPLQYLWPHSGTWISRLQMKRLVGFNQCNVSAVNCLRLQKWPWHFEVAQRLSLVVCAAVDIPESTSKQHGEKIKELSRKFVALSAKCSKGLVKVIFQLTFAALTSSHTLPAWKRGDDGPAVNVVGVFLGLWPLQLHFSPC